MKVHFYFFTVALTAITIQAFGQTDKQIQMKKMIDSMKMEGLSEYAKKYPFLRQGSLTTEIIGSGNVTGELNGNQLFEGKEKVTRIRSNFNIPISQWGKNAITGTVNYQQQRYQVTDITNSSLPFNGNNIDVTKATVGLSASYSRADSIFNRPVIYSGGITGITDEASSIRRLNYTGSINFPIKRTETNALTLGLVVIIDPSSVFPVIPVVSYWHKYKADNLELFIDLPSRVVIRKQFSKRSWATVGSELGGNLQFFDLNQPTLPRDAIYTSIEIRSGLNFEYLVAKKLILGVNGGILSTASSRMFGSHDLSSDYFFKSKNASVPYISFSVSFLPFLKAFN